MAGLSDGVFKEEFPELKALHGQAIMTRANTLEGGGAIIVLMAFSMVEGVDGSAIELTPVAARQFAAELLNAADEIDPPA